MKITYKELEDGLFPSLKEMHQLSLPNASVDDFISLAENLSECEKISKDFWIARENLLQTYAEVDEKGEKIVVRKEGEPDSYRINNIINYNKKFAELLSTEKDIKIIKVKKSIFEDVKGLKPIIVKGLLIILK